MTAISQPPTTSSATIIGDWRHNLLLACVALAEVLWIAPALQWSLILFDDPLPMPLNYWLGLVSVSLLGGVILRRWLSHRDVASTRQMPILLLGIIISLLLSISLLPILMEEQTTPTFDYAAAFDFTRSDLLPTGFILLPIVFGLFMRGVALGRSSLTHIGVGILMRFGILVFFLVALLSAFPVGDSIKRLREEMVTLLPLFFAASLMASALSRSAALRIEDDLRQSRFGLSWLGFLTITVLILTTLGFLLSIVLAGIDREQALKIVELPFTVLITLLFILASPILIGVEKVVEILKPEETPPQEVEIIGGTREVREGRHNEGLEIGDTLSDIISFVTEGIGLIILVLLVGFIIFFWVMVFLGNNENPRGEHRETIERRETIGGLRKALFKRLKKLGDALGLVRQFGIGRDLFAAFTIRWAYARMERTARKRGFPRQVSQTPYEYRQLLAQAFPGGEKSIRVITNAYVAIRYGELPEDNNKLEAVREALDYLKEIPAPTP